MFTTESVLLILLKLDGKYQMRSFLTSVTDQLSISDVTNQ